MDKVKLLADITEAMDVWMMHWNANPAMDLLRNFKVFIEESLEKERLNKWFEPQMNGNDEGIMKSLSVSIPGDVATGKQAEIMRSYMAELWARELSKKDFLTWRSRNGF